MDAHARKRAAVLARIDSHEDAIRRAEEFLESGAHADWHGFRPRFADKLRDGVSLPPHADWIRSTFLRRMHRALRDAERVLETLDRRASERAR